MLQLRKGVIMVAMKLKAIQRDQNRALKSVDDKSWIFVTRMLFRYTEYVYQKTCLLLYSCYISI